MRTVGRNVRRMILKICRSLCDLRIYEYTESLKGQWIFLQPINMMQFPMDQFFIKTALTNFTQLRKFHGTYHCLIDIDKCFAYSQKVRGKFFLASGQEKICKNFGNFEKLIEWKVEKVNCQSIFTHQYSAPRCRVFGEVIICNWDKQRQTT